MRAFYYFAFFSSKQFLWMIQLFGRLISLLFWNSMRISFTDKLHPFPIALTKFTNHTNQSDPRGFFCLLRSYANTIDNNTVSRCQQRVSVHTRSEKTKTHSIFIYAMHTVNLIKSNDGHNNVIKSNGSSASRTFSKVSNKTSANVSSLAYTRSTFSSYVWTLWNEISIDFRSM